MDKMDKTYEIYMIKDKSETKNNVYIIMDKKTKKAAIIDPACTIEQIEEFVKLCKLSIDAVLITHTHCDHVRSVDHIVERYNCNVYISRMEIEYYGYKCNKLCTFEDGEEIKMGETNIKCILTPGHTFGSTCFLLKGDLFSGDTVFMEGCGWCDYDGGSADSMFDSLEKIKRLVSDDIAVYPGHTYIIQPGQKMQFLKMNNIYLALDDKSMFIKFRRRKGQEDLYCFT